MLKKILMISMAAIMTVTLTACLVSVDSDSRSLESNWNEGDVARLEVGASDTEWVATTFGDPLTKLRYADGSEIWKYRNRSERDTEVGLFLLLSVDVEEERIETLSIEFADGLVANYWVETEEH